MRRGSCSANIRDEEKSTTTFVCPDYQLGHNKKMSTVSFFVSLLLFSPIPFAEVALLKLGIFFCFRQDGEALPGRTADCSSFVCTVPF